MIKVNSKLIAVTLSLLLINFFILSSCRHSEPSEDKEEIEKEGYANEVQNEHAQISDSSQNSQTPVNVSVKTFKQDNGWGYDVFIDDKLYIHQPNIPAVPGNNGFKSEEAAKKAAEMVAYKIKNHIMPPSLTPEELDSLGVR